MKLKLVSIKKAIKALERSIKVISSAEEMDQLSYEAQETVKSGVIHNFEVAYEQAWKTMKRWLENNAVATEVDGVTRRELFRLAVEYQLVADVDVWMGFHKARNETSHTYDGDIAQEVLEVAHRFLTEVKIFLTNLEKHND